MCCLQKLLRAGELFPAEKNLRLEAMKGIFDGSKTLFIHVNYVKEIEDAVHFAKEAGIKKTGD